MPKVLHYNGIYFVTMRIAPEIYKMFVYKHIETMNMLKSSHFLGKLQLLIQELVLRMRNFQDIVFI